MMVSVLLGYNCTQLSGSFFKFAELRPGQLEATLAVLHNKDVFVRMATGVGKSLCMFLPPLAANDNSMGLIVY